MIDEQYFEANDKKHFLTSKTIWFNLVAGLFAVLSSHTELLISYLSDGGYFTVLMIVSAGNTYLRFITDKGVRT